MTIADERAAVVAEALTWVGTAFRHATRAKGVGVDCANLVGAAFAPVITVDFPPYPPDWFLHSARERLVEVIEQHCTAAPAPVQPGDIATFRFGRAVSHAGIVVSTAPLVMVHAFRPARGVALHEFDVGSGFAARLATVWRLNRWMD